MAQSRRDTVWQFNTGRLVAHWRFDDAAGQRVTDASGHGYDGQIRGNPVWADGIAGGALQFDGDGDYVEIGTNPEFNITESDHGRRMVQDRGL